MASFIGRGQGIRRGISGSSVQYQLQSNVQVTMSSELCSIMFSDMLQIQNKTGTSGSTYRLLAYGYLADVARSNMKGAELWPSANIKHHFNDMDIIWTTLFNVRLPMQNAKIRALNHFVLRKLFFIWLPWQQEFCIKLSKFFENFLWSFMIVIDILPNLVNWINIRCFITVSLYMYNPNKNMWPKHCGQFWSNDHKLSNLFRCLSDYATYQGSTEK